MINLKDLLLEKNHVLEMDKLFVFGSIKCIFLEVIDI
jgi:hypothetical protein